MRRIGCALLLIIIMLSVGPSHLSHAQDDDGPQQYVTASGLVLTIPPDWTVTEYGLAGFLTIANHGRPGNPDLAPAELSIDIEHQLPAPQQQSTVQTASEGELIREAAEDFLNAGGETSLIDTLTVSDRAVFRMRGLLGDDFVTLYTFLQNDLSFKLRAQTGDANLDAFEEDILTMIAALRFDSDPVPATATLLPSPTALPDDAPTPMVTATPAPPNPVLWVQNIEDTDSPNGIGALDEVVDVGDGTLIVSDSFTAATVDAATGTILERIPGDPTAYNSFLYLQFGPDAVLYGWDTGGNLVKLRRDLSVIQSLRLEGPALAIVRSMSFSPRGDLFVYGVTQDSQLVVLIFDTAGQIRGTLNVDSAVSNTLFTSAAVIARPDGNLLYVDAQHDSRLLTSGGALVELQPLQQPDLRSGSPDFVAPSLAIDGAGRLFVLSGYGLVVYDAEGTIIARIDDIALENGERFAAGQVPPRGDLALVGDDQLVVVGSNGSFSVITLLDIPVLLAFYATP